MSAGNAGATRPGETVTRDQVTAFAAFEALPETWRKAIADCGRNVDPVWMREARNRWTQDGLTEADQLYRLKVTLRLVERRATRATYGAHHPQAAGAGQ